MATSPFARKAVNPMQKWASHDPGDDLHIEPGRPQKARHADENAKNELRRERDYAKPEDKAKIDTALAKFKVGQKVTGSPSAFKMGGKTGTITKMERGNAGQFVYTIALVGGGTERALESELKRA